jgi:hypothetical protein
MWFRINGRRIAEHAASRRSEVMQPERYVTLVALRSRCCIQTAASTGTAARHNTMPRNCGVLRTKLWAA